MIINRIDDTEKILRCLENKLDVEWKYRTEFQDHRGENAEVSSKTLLSIMSRHYFPPYIFFKNSDKKVPSNPMKPSFSSTLVIVFKVLGIIDTLTDYATKRVSFLPIGGDFRYENAISRFQHLDVLIILIQSNNDEKGPMPQTKAQYTNLQQYLDDVRAAS